MPWWSSATSSRCWPSATARRCRRNHSFLPARLGYCRSNLNLRLPISELKCAFLNPHSALVQAIGSPEASRSECFIPQKFCEIARRVCCADAKSACQIQPQLHMRKLTRMRISGLTVAASRQVCYADVKPANFLLKDRFPTPAASSLRTQQPCRALPPDVRVIDFGCAQRVTEGTKLQKRTGAARHPSAVAACAVGLVG